MHEAMNPKLALVTGGASSGKTAFAVALAESFGGPSLYIATATARDEEMRKKIEAHQLRRGAGWETLECPTGAAGAIRERRGGETILVDCLTLWLSGLLEAGQNVPEAIEDLVNSSKASPCPVIMVTNELGQGIVPADRQSRVFRDLHGQMNQQVAKSSSLVVNVVSGIPIALKGALPETGP